MDQIFGPENSCPIILMRKSGWAATKLLPQVHDFILWYAKDKTRVKFRQLYVPKALEDIEDVQSAWVESPDGRITRPISQEERENPRLIPEGWRLFAHDNLTSEGHSPRTSVPYQFMGKEYWPGVGKRTDRHWKTLPEGLDRLAAQPGLCDPLCSRGGRQGVSPGLPRAAPQGKQGSRHPDSRDQGLRSPDQRQGGRGAPVGGGRQRGRIVRSLVLPTGQSTDRRPGRDSLSRRRACPALGRAVPCPS